MSYKYIVWRCVDCGAVWHDPPRDDQGDDDGHTLATCRLAYVGESGMARACGGVVRPFALVDCDSYIATYPDWSRKP